jgi:tetratricopeptide (TPR) repeat protein
MRRCFFQYFIPAAIMSLIFICIPAHAYSADAIRYHNEGNELINEKNYSRAITAFDNAIALEPGYYEAWNNKADALNKNNQSDEALIASDHAISLNPQYVQGWINRGTILYMLKRYDEELKAYDTAISIEPTNTTAWFFKGFSLGGMEKYDEAIAAFDKVRSLDPDYPRLDIYRQMAVQKRDAERPFYIKNPLIPIVVAIGTISALVWYLSVKKKH